MEPENLLDRIEEELIELDVGDVSREEDTVEYESEGMKITFEIFDGVISTESDLLDGVLIVNRKSTTIQVNGDRDLDLRHTKKIYEWDSIKEVDNHDVEDVDEEGYLVLNLGDDREYMFYLLDSDTRDFEKAIE